MKIIVVGCGKIGSTIIESLVEEHHEVLAIDKNFDVVNKMIETYDVMGICGNGASYDKLMEADVERADLFVAVTESDELNMLSCFIARKLGVRHAVARVRNSEYNTESLQYIKRNLSLSMTINPELLAAEAIYNVLRLPTASAVETFTARRFEMIEFYVHQGSTLDGVKLMDLKKNPNMQFLICAIKRGDETFIPNGSSEIRNGDKIALIAPHDDTHTLLKSFGTMKKQARSAIIVGGSTTAQYLAMLLAKNRISVKIIEKDKERAQFLGENLPEKVAVVCGDGTDPELMREEGVASVDAIVAITGKDEENILIAYDAKLGGVGKVIVKVNRDGLFDVAEKLGIESIFSPRKLVADVVVRYARALESSIGSTMETLYSVMDGEVEALEFDVMPDFSHVGVALKEMKLKKNVLIAAILRGNDAIIPSGDDVIQSGDKIIVVSSQHRLCELSDIIR